MDPRLREDDGMKERKIFLRKDSEITRYQFTILGEILVRY